MSAHRFFLTGPLPAAGEAGAITLPLSAEDLHHAVMVLRLRSGEIIEVVEPGSRAPWRVRVVDVVPGALTVSMLERVAESSGEPHVVLIQGVAKGEKMDAIVRQTVEVGVSRIIPVFTERTIVRLDAAKAAARGDRWRRIARSAAEQAHRTFVPSVDDPVPLEHAMSRLDDVDATVVLWESEDSVTLTEVLQPLGVRGSARVALVVGPEGGLSASEVDMLRGNGAITASLSRNILRTETAAVVAVALTVRDLEYGQARE